jgi:hypothetical protein
VRALESRPALSKTLTAADDASSHVPPEKNLDLSNFFL